MTLHLCVLGIDGSGKSTLVRSLPARLAAELGVRAGAAGDEFLAVTPQQDLLLRDFAPRGRPLAQRLALALRRLARRLAGGRRLYPAVKLVQMLVQDHAARGLARRERLDVVVSDGNALLSAMGRAANYLAPAGKRGGTLRSVPRPEDLETLLGVLLDGRPLPDDCLQRVPQARHAGALLGLLRGLHLEAPWLPDLVVLLDLPAARALERIHGRGRMADRHENLPDLDQARASYLATLEALRRHRPARRIERLDGDGRSPGAVSSRIVELVAQQFARTPGSAAADAGARQRAGSTQGATIGKRRNGAGSAAEFDASGVLGRPHSGLNAARVWSKVLQPAYLLRCLLRHAHRGAWRELAFPFSRPGRRLLREGYSAELMLELYRARPRRSGWFERAFLGHPLHRAVRERLALLQRELRAELRNRLERGETVAILSAPSGFALDVLGPLESLAARISRGSMARVRLVAADLDPHGAIAPALQRRAACLGVGLELVRGDLTAAAVRERLRALGPYDVAVFAGLSSWLAKPALMAHLRLLREVLTPGGVLATDCFSAAAYALSGHYAGFRASYYTPELYASLLDAAGFDGRAARVLSGRSRLNSILLVRPRSPAQAPRQQAAAQRLAGVQEASSGTEDPFR